METKFKLGQKVWSIQLGDCEVLSIYDKRDDGKGVGVPVELIRIKD